VHGRTEYPYGHLTHPSALVGDHHSRGDGDHLVFAWPTRALLASITSQRMHGPCANAFVLVAEIFDQLRHRCLVQIMVEHYAASDAHSGVRMTKTIAQCERGRRATSHELPKRLFCPVLDRKVLDVAVVVSCLGAWIRHDARSR
jgi:hypothetical protein